MKWKTNEENEEVEYSSSNYDNEDRYQKRNRLYEECHKKWGSVPLVYGRMDDKVDEFLRLCVDKPDVWKPGMTLDDAMHSRN